VIPKEDTLMADWPRHKGTNVPDDQAPLEPGDNELHPELADIVTVQKPQDDETDQEELQP
jgi:hypothetical protein